MPTGENAALSMLGVLLYAGHCDAYPTATYAEVMADAANGFANVETMQRASIWQYTAMADETTLDVNATIATDYAVCFNLEDFSLMFTAAQILIGSKTQPELPLMRQLAP